MRACAQCAGSLRMCAGAAAEMASTVAAAAAVARGGFTSKQTHISTKKAAMHRYCHVVSLFVSPASISAPPSRSAVVPFPGVLGVSFRSWRGVPTGLGERKLGPLRGLISFGRLVLAGANRDAGSGVAAMSASFSSPRSSSLCSSGVCDAAVSTGIRVNMKRPPRPL